MSPDRVERKLAAILAADVAGYSRLMGVDEEATLTALRAQIDEEVRNAIRMPALQGAIPEMLFLRDPNLIQRSEAPAAEAL